MYLYFDHYFIKAQTTLVLYKHIRCITMNLFLLEYMFYIYFIFVFKR